MAVHRAIAVPLRASPKGCLAVAGEGATVLVSPFRPGLVRWHAAPPRGINKLVVNVQAARLDSAYLAQTAVFFKELPTEKADTLAIGLFGVYTAISAEPHTLDNMYTETLTRPFLPPFR